MSDEIADIVDSYYEANPQAERHRGGWYVTLYCTIPFYGGPEEGGWWGQDTAAEASQHYITRAEAERALRAVQDSADSMAQSAEREYGDWCIRSCEWLDVRGLDDDYLPQVAGARGYYAALEAVAGSHSHRDSRHYE